RGISENGQILTGKRPCHLDEHRAHQRRDFVHLDAAIEYEAQIVLFIEQSTLNRLVLWIGFANPIQKLNLALLEITFGLQVGGAGPLKSDAARYSLRLSPFRPRNSVIRPPVVCGPRGCYQFQQASLGQRWTFSNRAFLDFLRPNHPEWQLRLQ